MSLQGFLALVVFFIFFTGVKTIVLALPQCKIRRGMLRALNFTLGVVILGFAFAIATTM